MWFVFQFLILLSNPYCALFQIFQVIYFIQLCVQLCKYTNIIIKENFDRLYYIKTYYLCSSKDAIKRINGKLQSEKRCLQYVW